MKNQKNFTPERTGTDRRIDIDRRNPTLQERIREFWHRYFQDNPEKERRRGNDRRREFA
jgi:hypothetical protein